MHEERDMVVFFPADSLQFSQAMSTQGSRADRNRAVDPIFAAEYPMSL